MERIEAAILKTVLYADVFQFPLTPAEIHHFLISDEPVSYDAVTTALATSPRLNEALEQAEGYVFVAGQRHLATMRAEREAASDALWPLALRYGRWLSRLPFVNMVALTGALAMRNAASPKDDLDYLLVTTPGRVWLARAFSILLVRLARLRGDTICPNYVLAETALVQKRHDLFIAHEVAQTIPITGQAYYQQLREANSWVDACLPNATAPFHTVEERKDPIFWRVVKGAGEALLAGKPGDLLEAWEYRRKLRKFAHDLSTPNSAAELDDQQVKGHFQDHGHPVLNQYFERLQRYCLVEEADYAAAD